MNEKSSHQSGNDGSTDEVPNSGRRRALRLCGVVSGLSIGATTVSSIAVADPETEDNKDCGSSCGGGYPYRYAETDHYSVDNGRATANGDLVTGFFEYEPLARENYDYWTIPVQIKSDAATYHEDYDEGLKEHIDSSTMTVSWNDDKYPNKRNVVAEKDKSHIGAQEGLHDQDYDYGDVAGDIIEYARDELIGMVPYAGQLYSASKVAAEMYGKWDDAHSAETWQTQFDWGQDNRTDKAKQVSSWNKLDIELYEDQSIEINIEDRVTCFPTDLVDQFNWNVVAPGYSPNTASTFSIQQREDAGIKTIRGRRVRKNPSAYGLTTSDVQDIHPNEKIFIATRQRNKHKPNE